MRILLLWIAVQTAWACSCLPSGVAEDAARAAVVFRGVATAVKPLPARAESARPRYAVTFAAKEFWKGKPAKEVVLYVVEPGTDCVGARFVRGMEYVVFAKEEMADDHKLGDEFWFGWLDVLPKGQVFLTGDNFCDSTGPVKTAGKVLRELRRANRRR